MEMDRRGLLGWLASTFIYLSLPKKKKLLKTIEPTACRANPNLLEQLNKDLLKIRKEGHWIYRPVMGSKDA